MKNPFWLQLLYALFGHHILIFYHSLFGFGLLMKFNARNAHMVNIVTRESIQFLNGEAI